MAQPLDIDPAQLLRSLQALAQGLQTQLQLPSQSSLPAPVFTPNPSSGSVSTPLPPGVLAAFSSAANSGLLQPSPPMPVDPAQPNNDSSATTTPSNTASTPSEPIVPYSGIPGLSTRGSSVAPVAPSGTTQQTSPAPPQGTGTRPYPPFINIPGLASQITRADVAVANRNRLASSATDRSRSTRGPAYPVATLDPQALSQQLPRDPPRGPPSSSNIVKLAVQVFPPEDAWGNSITKAAYFLYRQVEEVDRFTQFGLFFRDVEVPTSMSLSAFFDLIIGRLGNPPFQYQISRPPAQPNDPRRELPFHFLVPRSRGKPEKDGNRYTKPLEPLAWSIRTVSDILQHPEVKRSAATGTEVPPATANGDPQQLIRLIPKLGPFSFLKDGRRHEHCLYRRLQNGFDDDREHTDHPAIDEDLSTDDDEEAATSSRRSHRPTTRASVQGPSAPLVVAPLFPTPLAVPATTATPYGTPYLPANTFPSQSVPTYPSVQEGPQGPLRSPTPLAPDSFDWDQATFPDWDQDVILVDPPPLPPPNNAPIPAAEELEAPRDFRIRTTLPAISHSGRLFQAFEAPPPVNGFDHSPSMSVWMKSALHYAHSNSSGYVPGSRLTISGHNIHDLGQRFLERAAKAVSTGSFEGLLKLPSERSYTIYRPNTRSRITSIGEGLEPEAFEVLMENILGRQTFFTKRRGDYLSLTVSGAVSALISPHRLYSFAVYGALVGLSLLYVGQLPGRLSPFLIQLLLHRNFNALTEDFLKAFDNETYEDIMTWRNLGPTGSIGNNPTMMAYWCTYEPSRPLSGVRNRTPAFHEAYEAIMLEKIAIGEGVLGSPESDAFTYGLNISFGSGRSLFKAINSFQGGSYALLRDACSTHIEHFEDLNQNFHISRAPTLSADHRLQSTPLFSDLTCRKLLLSYLQGEGSVSDLAMQALVAERGCPDVPASERNSPAYRCQLFYRMGTGSSRILPHGQRTFRSINLNDDNEVNTGVTPRSVEGLLQVTFLDYPNLSYHHDGRAGAVCFAEGIICSHTCSREIYIPAPRLVSIASDASNLSVARNRVATYFFGQCLLSVSSHSIL